MLDGVSILLGFTGFVYVLAWSTVRLCEARQRQMQQQKLDELLRGEGWL